MQGLMMHQPLLMSSLLMHAERHHGAQEIVSRRVEGDIHRYTYRDLASRSRKMAKALAALDVRQGSRVATLAWNGYRHLEMYYSVSGSGAVLHSLNPRLHPDQLAWIVRDAGDELVFFDLTFLPLIEAIAPHTPSVRAFVALTDRVHMPPSASIPNLLCSEDLLASQDDRFDWPSFDEESAASLCYTSGTTGNPKGVLYSHRSTVLHTYAVALPDSNCLSARDVVLPVVPMFHVNAWGLPYGASMVGAKLVLPGAALDGKSLHELFEAEQVTITCGVPTVWQALLDYTDYHKLSFTSLKRVGIGGAACPPEMLRTFELRYGIAVHHGWGMTETSPFATAGALKADQAALPEDERLSIKARQGRCVFGIDMKIADDAGADLPWDGQTSGNLLVRGPWVVASYYGQTGLSPLVDGWFPTGDIATIDAAGFMQITDRSKDVIKSGGEWISSIELENVAMAHPAVAMAACVGVPHPKWDERPLLIVVRKAGAQVSRDNLIAHFGGKVAKWWTPDDVVFVESIPLGTTGKMLKSQLREQFREHPLPTA